MATTNIWDKFDKEVNTEGLAADVQEAAANGASFKEVPHGEYEVKVDKMELTASKAGDPMVSIWFKVVSDGEFKNNRIFYNQVITQGFQIHLANELLRNMETDLEIEFKTYNQYGNLLMDVFEAVDGNMEFALKYGEGKKGFSTYEITEVFDVE